MRVRDLMARPVETVNPDTTIKDAARKMRELGVGLLPVATGKGLIGVLTDRDITIRATAQGLDPKTTPVDEAMSLGVVACFADQDTEEAARIMKKAQVQGLLVLDGKKQPVGILSLVHLSNLNDTKEQSHE